MALTLKDALAIASRYAGSKLSGQNMNVVVLRDGMVRATDGISGCEIPCPAVEGLDLAVDAAALRKMVAAIGDDATLKVAKGRKLTVSGPGVRYSLQAIPEGAEPPFPAVPVDGWRAVSRLQVAALGALAGVIDLKAAKPQFQGLRLTPTWAAAASDTMVVFLWAAAGLVDEPFLIPPSLFLDAASDGELATDEGRMYLRTSDGQVRWALGLALDYPDETIEQVVVMNREMAEREMAQVKIADVALLAKQATAVSDDRALGLRMSLTPSDDGATLRLTGRRDAVDFDGAIAADGEVRKEVYVGTRAHALAQLCAVVDAAGGDAHYLSIGSPVNPVMIRNDGELVVEGLLLPVRVE